MEFSAPTRAEIKRLYKGRNHVDLSIGILKDGQAAYARFDPAGNEVSGPPAIYPVGSICKVFTASLLAKYVAEGRLDLAASIREYLPDLPERWYPNLERLATHTSGYKTQPYTLLTTLPFFLRMNRETGSAVAVAVNYGLVNAEQIGFSILKNDL